MKIFKFFSEMKQALAYLLLIVVSLIVTILYIIVEANKIDIIKFVLVISLLISILSYGIYVQYSSWRTMYTIGEKLVELRKLRRRKDDKKQSE